MATGQNLDLMPANGVQGSSYIYDMGTSPNTRSAVSQKVRILTPAYGDQSGVMNQMGVVSSFAPTMSRDAEEVRGIGFGDQVAELVPGITTAPTGSMERALLYLCNLWQAAGYAGGIDGPVRSLAHHRWPFDMEQQMVFSTLADADLLRANEGYSGQTGSFDGGVKAITYPEVTPDVNGYPEGRGHSAIITMYEACWFTNWSLTNLSKDAALLMESGDVKVSDMHDFASMYGEFLATGNDPSIGQLGSIRFAESAGLSNGLFASVGGGLTGGGTQSEFVDQIQT
jgi:hypothetical protein